MLATITFLMLLLQAVTLTTAQGAWRKGRSTHYGTDAWSIHKGSCGYGYIWQDEPLGWNVAAIPDVHFEYDNSCGTCYEVACEKMNLYDNYGQWLDRTNACFDDQASLVVRITDTCPCYYPANSYSNKRWCCGDMDHLDLSVWAWEKLADKRWGVIGIKYRPVPCNYQPEKQAWSSLPASPAIQDPPPGASKPAVRDWPEYWDSSTKAPVVIFDDWFQASWYQSSLNTWVQPFTDSATSGMRGSTALCSKIMKNGAISLKSSETGAFGGHVALEFWVYVGVTGWEGTSATVPDIEVLIAGDQGACTEVRLMQVTPTAFEPRCRDCADYWWKWVMYLEWFNGAQINSMSQPNYFNGCGGNGVWNLNEIRFHNRGWGRTEDKWVCLDTIRLR